MFSKFLNFRIYWKLAIGNWSFKKSFIQFCFLITFLFFSTTNVLAQNKAGIHIGDHFGDFNKAAEIVGVGGWVVLMACPGDGDKIEQIIIDNPNVNIVIRGHYPGLKPTADLAKAWAATLGSLATRGVPFNKIYFVPWNEPNQLNRDGAKADDWAEPSELNDYINQLAAVLADQGIRGSKVVLLSPMLNRTIIGGTGDFDNYVGRLRALNSNFFSQFDGIAMNLYQTCYDASCQNDPHSNPLIASQLLGSMGASGKEIYGVEAGTAGDHFYFLRESLGYLVGITEKLLNVSNLKMFAVPAYDLGSEVDQTWNLFDPENETVVNLLKNAPKGGLNPSSYNQALFRTAVPLCPGKFNSYSPDTAYCSDCGSLLTSCKLNKTNEFGEEKSKETIDFKQEARYVKRDGECLSATYVGKIQISGLEIPFVKGLNKYFLGPYVDNPIAKINKTDFDPLKDTGVLEKLLPADFQDELRLKFLSEISGNPRTRYVNFKINGRDSATLTADFSRIRVKLKNGTPLTASEKQFLAKIWPQVPLIANEESEGEIVFSGTGINTDFSKVKTSVPEVYRLNKATELVAMILGTKNQSVQGQSTSQTGQVLQAVACSETQKVDPDLNAKETKAGAGEAVCVKPSIQTSENQLEGNRTFINDAGQDCAWQGGCDVNPDGSDLSNVRDRCCGNQGKCHIKQNPDGTYYGECDDGAANKCEGNYCWGGGSDFVLHCCVLSDSEKTRNFDDTKLNSLNKVPFLNKIAEYTVGKRGFFKIFFPADSQQSPLFQQAFREVAGESKASVNIEINPNITKNMRSFSVSPVSNPSPLTLLFHKLGTLINVKALVAGKVLWPYKYGSEFIPSEPGELDYTIDFRNSGAVISSETKNRIIADVKRYWPSSPIDTKWDYVIGQAVSHGWNPAFVLTLWIEESGASGVPNIEYTYDLGCLGGAMNNLASQLDCLFDQTSSYSSGTFEQFMCMYSEGKSAPCTFITNAHFPGNIKSWYNNFVPFTN